MPIAVACECGKSYQVKEALAGRKLRCQKCQRILTVPQPRAGDAEDAAGDFLLSEPDEEAPRSTAVREKAGGQENPGTRDEEGIRPGPAPTTPPKGERTLQNLFENRKPRSDEDRRRDRSGPTVVVNPEILIGLAMMLGAAVWFFGALAAGYIYFYPPILFLLGIGTVIKGFTGKG